MLSNQKGVALGMVVIFATLIGILATVAYKFTGTQADMSYHMTKRAQALYSARGGMEYGLFRLRTHDPDSFLPDFTKTGEVYEKQLNIDDPFGTTQASVNRKSVEVRIQQDTDQPMTSDGIRSRYKVTSKVEYGR